MRRIMTVVVLSSVLLSLVQAASGPALAEGCELGFTLNSHHNIGGKVIIRGRNFTGGAVALSFKDSSGKTILIDTPTPINGSFHVTWVIPAGMSSGKGTFKAGGCKAPFRIGSCKGVAGAGEIVGTQGPTAVFHFHVGQIRAVLHFHYFRFKDGAVDVEGTALTEYEVVSATTRHFEGIATINGQPGTFAVDAVDNSSTGEPDTFSITLSQGYSASGAVIAGDVRLHNG